MLLGVDFRILGFLDEITNNTQFIIKRTIAEALSEAGYGEVIEDYDGEYRNRYISPSSSGYVNLGPRQHELFIHYIFQVLNTSNDKSAFYIQRNNQGNLGYFLTTGITSLFRTLHEQVPEYRFLFVTEYIPEGDEIPEQEEENTTDEDDEINLVIETDTEEYETSSQHSDEGENKEEEIIDGEEIKVKDEGKD